MGLGRTFEAGACRYVEVAYGSDNGVTRINIFEPTVLVAYFNSWTGARQRTKSIVPFANRLIVGPMDRISDGIEWRSEQQELFLWLFQQAGARGGLGLHGPPARRRGRLREPWSLDADGELAAYQQPCGAWGKRGSR